MTSIINTGLSGLLAAQAAIQTTSNNVANAGTDGYARQRVDLVERNSSRVGSFTVGNGVQIDGVTRIYDQFVAAELKSATMAQGRASQLNDLTTRLDGLLGNPEEGIGRDLQTFFAQAETLNREPTSQVARQQLLNSGRDLGARFAQLDSQLNRLSDEVDSRLEGNVNTINNLASNLARVNETISVASGSAPNELLNEQERLLTDLAQLIDFTAVPQADGSTDVLIGSGQPLVVSGQSFSLGVTQNEFNGSRLEIAYNGQSISNLVSGGEVAGLLSFRRDVLDVASRELGQLALGVANLFNEQHRQGVDLNGNLGGDFFRGISASVQGSSNNTGSATLTATIASAADTQPREYILRNTGSGWGLIDAGTDAPLTLSGSGTTVDPFVFDGLEVVVSGSAASGDRFLVSATGSASTGVEVALVDGNQIAAANPLTTGRSLNNLSDASISAAQVADVGNPNLQQALDIVFDDPNTYRIVNTLGGTVVGATAYTSGADINVNGWTVQINGPALTNDRFTIRGTGAGSGDNSNALALSQIGSEGFFDGGQQSLANLSGNLIANVGAAAARADSDLEVQSALREQIQLDLESISGVNLEEEAANLLRYQEAYLAASKVITVANDLFNSLLNAVR